MSDVLHKYKIAVEDAEFVCLLVASTVNFVLAYPSSTVLFNYTCLANFKGYVLELHKTIIVLVRTCMSSAKHLDCSHSGRTFAFYLIFRLRIFSPVRKVSKVAYANTKLTVSSSRTNSIVLFQDSPYLHADSPID
jgi:hypothetical protein